MTDETREIIEREIRRIAKGIEEEFNVTCALTYTPDYPPLYNDPEVTESEEFAHASSILYFQVEDIHAGYEELLSKEVTFIDEPHLIAKMGQTETWMAFFKDGEGNTHALMSEIQV